MTLSRDEILADIRKIDEKFSDRWFVYPLRLFVGIPRIIFAALAMLLAGFGYYYSRIALSAAEANLLDLSVALQALIISLLALVFTILAIITNEEWRRKDDVRFEAMVFRRLKNADSDTIALRALIRMKMTLPKGISLKDAHHANSQLFSEKEF